MLSVTASAVTVGLIIKDSLITKTDDSTKSDASCNSVKCEVGNVPLSKVGPKILFLGSGSSTGCPKPICSLIFPPTVSSDDSSNSTLTKLQQGMQNKCKVSRIAAIGNPVNNKNYRNNPSILISHCNDDNDTNYQQNREPEYKNVIIDVGKTFRESALRWMPLNSIYSVDAIVLTHEHADAVLGLDDLRGFQMTPFMLKSNHSETKVSISSSSLPVFLSSNCFDKVKQQFDYLVPKQDRNNTFSSKCCCSDDTTKEGNNNKPIVERAVASLQFNIVNHFQPFVAAGLVMTPLPVMHGEDLICNGYAFSLQSNDTKTGKGNSISTRKTTNVVYLSDISRMIPETEDYILNKLPQPTDILIIDSLLMKESHPVHFSLEQALEVVKRLKPKKTYVVGMNCDAFPEHDEANTMLEKLHPSVQLAHDGLFIEA